MSFWAPTNLNQMVGNTNSFELLRAILGNKDKAPRAFLFDGPHGCGKTTVAKVFATGLLPEQTATLVDPERFGSLLQQEDIADYPCLIWDNADRLTRDQCDALSALMDKASTKTVMIFITSDAGRLGQGLRARTLRISCSKLAKPEMAGLLSSVCSSHSLNFEVGALNLIADQAQGVPSVAIRLLEATSMLGDVTVTNVKTVGTSLDDQALRLMRLIANQMDPWELATQMKDSNPFEAIVDAMFTTYSNAFINKHSDLLEKLSNYRRVGEIFLKWKSAPSVPPSATYILVRELMDSNQIGTVTMVTAPAAKSEIQRDRQMTGPELDALLMKARQHGDS